VRPVWEEIKEYRSTPGRYSEAPDSDLAIVRIVIDSPSFGEVLFLAFGSDNSGTIECVISVHTAVFMLIE
jgi:hypothetical protein